MDYDGCFTKGNIGTDFLKKTVIFIRSQLHFYLRLVASLLKTEFLYFLQNYFLFFKDNVFNT